MNTANHALLPPGMLSRVINSKQDIIAYYEHLMRMTADSQNISVIRAITLDEMRQLDSFIRLYAELFGTQPDLPVRTQPRIGSFLDGVKHAVAYELDTYMFYGNIYFSEENPEVRATFSRALFEENSHSGKFDFIYAKLLEEAIHTINPDFPD